MRQGKMFSTGNQPFIKWRGGKRKIAPQIIKKFPKDFTNYYEPFLGGGAVFLQARYLCEGYIFLSDINEALINTWNCLISRKEEVLSKLNAMSLNHSEEFFYTIRNNFYNSDYVEYDYEIFQAAAFIYLNKAGFNGLWRTNLKGGLNMSFGHGQITPGKNLIDENNLEGVISACSTNVRILSRCYKIIPEPHEKSLIYCDPPYDSTNVMYDKSRFSREDQEELKEQIDNWSKSGCYVILSNSNTEFIRDLYKGYRILNILANHQISGRASGRRKVKEVLVLNY